MTRRSNTIQTFWENVDTSGDCWLWTGGLTTEGYGDVWLAKTRQGAHRISYGLLNGLSSEPLDHTCHNSDLSCPGGTTCQHRRCVNPTHLERVPQRINLLRGRGFNGRNASQTHCPAGHRYDEANTYVWRDHRSCRACRRAAVARYKAKSAEQ